MTKTKKKSKKELKSTKVKKVKPVKFYLTKDKYIEFAYGGFELPCGTISWFFISNIKKRGDEK